MSAATITSPVVTPISKEQAAPEVQPIFEKLTHVFGYMPAFYGSMARVPAALTNFMPLYSAVINKGSVEAKYKELAYLKTASINGCEYCFQRALGFRQKERRHRRPAQGAGVLSTQPGVRCQRESGPFICRASDARRFGDPAPGHRRAEAIFQRRSDRGVDSGRLRRQFHQPVQ